MMVKRMRVLAKACRDACGEGFDRAYEGKLLWETTVIPKILYGMELARVDGETMKIMEKCQVDLGRFLLRAGHLVASSVILWELGWLTIADRIRVKKLALLGHIQDDRAAEITKRISEDRKEIGWMEEANRELEAAGWDQEQREQAQGHTGAWIKTKMWEKAREAWRREMDNRVNERDGWMTWRRIYRHREESGRPWQVDESEEGRLLGKARIGDWEGNLMAWRKGEGRRECWACNMDRVDLVHSLVHCPAYEVERRGFMESYKEVMKQREWEAWVSSTEEEQVAWVLGLKGGSEKVQWDQ